VYGELALALGISRKALAAKIRSATTGAAPPRSLALAVHERSFAQLTSLRSQKVGVAAIEGAKIAIFDEALVDDPEVIDRMLRSARVVGSWTEPSALRRRPRLVDEGSRDSLPKCVTRSRGFSMP
jgi:hypothetical protein